MTATTPPTPSAPALLEPITGQALYRRDVSAALARRVEISRRFALAVPTLAARERWNAFMLAEGVW